MLSFLVVLVFFVRVLVRVFLCSGYCYCYCSSFALLFFGLFLLFVPVLALGRVIVRVCFFVPVRVMGRVRVLGLVTCSCYCA